MGMVLRNKVFEYRSRAGATQEQFAEEVGVSRQTVIAIEKGNYTPSVALAIKIARFFRARVEDLFTL